MNYEQLLNIANERIAYTSDNLPQNALDIALQLNIRVKNHVECKRDFPEEKYPLKNTDAILALNSGEYTIYYDENNSYSNFAIAHEIAHYLLGHTTDGAEQHHGAQLLAAIIIAPVKLVRSHHIKSAIKLSKPNVLGDYAILAQFLPWIGYSGTVGSNTITGVSQKLLDEIADTGIVGSYNGSVLKEIPNGYNYNKLTADGTNYDTILPAGLAFVTPTAPAGGVAPVQTFSIGGLTSFSGNNVSTGELMTRFDLAVAAGVADTSAIGILHDTQLDSLAD